MKDCIRYSFFLLFVFLFPLISKAQIKPVQEEYIDSKLESIAERENNEDVDYSNLFEQLSYFREHPLNLNYATREDLRQLNLLNDIQLNNLLYHIETNGKLLSVYELQSIDGFDLQFIKMIMPFIVISEKNNPFDLSFKSILSGSQHHLTIRSRQILEKEKGYLPVDNVKLAQNPDSKYLGSRQKILVRYRCNYSNKVSLGITGEKDPGEEFFKGTQKHGFDFYSGHFYVNNVKKVKALAIGDYQLSFGQGLVAWSGLAFSKTSDVMNVNKISLGIRPHTSVDENRFMRGLAATVALKNFEFTGFVSHKRVDASVLLTDTVTGEINTVSYLNVSGYHNTWSTFMNKNSLSQTLLGGNTTFKTKKLSIGITALNILLGADLKKNQTYYNQFEFSAKNLSNGSINYTYNFRNLNSFGEVAVSDNGGLAYINGLMVSLDSRLSVVIVNRNYQRNYQSLFSNGFSENTVTANEMGTYVGMNIKVSDQITVNAYYDRYAFPWLKYQVKAPSYGTDYLGQINYSLSKKFDMYFKFRFHEKFKNMNTVYSVDYIAPSAQTNYRYNISYNLSSEIKLRNRIEVVSINNSKNITEKGYLFYQDVIFRKFGSLVSFTGRYALFQTDSYNSRIYAYENDITGSYSIPSYYYKGSRFYLMVNYEITKKVELWFRYSQTFYDNRNTINEGSLDEIQGNTKSEVAGQVLFKF